MDEDDDLDIWDDDEDDLSKKDETDMNEPKDACASELPQASAYRYTLANLLKESKSESAAQILAGMNLAEAKLVDVLGVPHLVTPTGSEITEFDELMDAPKRLKAEPTFNETESFCRYVREFMEGGTPRLYADYSSTAITAILDDHRAGSPKWRDHKAVLKLRRSPEMEEWIKAAQEPIHQQGLADFFEAHIAQIVKPDATDLLSGVRSLTVSSNTKVVSVHREGGDLAIEIGHDTSASAKTSTGKLPLRLTLSIKPYRFWEKCFKLEVMLAYKLQGNGLYFTIKFLELDELFEQAFSEIRAIVEKKTELPVYL